MTRIICPRCDQPLTAPELLESAAAYWQETDSGTADCPRCKKGIEFRARSGVLELGFTYWAGAMHFDSVSSHRVKGLRVASVDGHTEATIGNRIFRLTPSQNSGTR